MTVNATSTHGRVETLDLLRVFAVLAVLMFHYCFRGALPDQSFTAVSLPALAPYAKYGFLGVQLFFVISGFVIAYSAEQRTAVDFGIARIARIYPGFMVCMTVTFMVTLALGAPRFHATLGQYLANFIIAAPALRQPFMDGAYWSLVYEMIFYAWIAAFLSTGWFRRRLDVIVVIWMAIAVLNHEVGSGVVRRLLLTDESGFFAAGLVMYEMYCGRRDLIVRLLLVLATLVAVGQSLELTEWGRVHYQVEYNDWIAAATSVLLVAVVGLALRVRSLPIPPRVAVAIGGITYPLYLLHQHIGYMIFNKVGVGVPPWLAVTGTAAIMTLLAWAVWRYVERPGQRLLKRQMAALAAHLALTIAAQRMKRTRPS